MVDSTCGGLTDFLSVYRQNMDLRGAADFYKFEGDRLHRMVADLGHRVVLFHAALGDDVVASVMHLVARSAYYFLSGATSEGKRTNATTLLMSEAVSWFHERGLSRFVLGGGLTDGDSLFKFKRSFAPMHWFRLRSRIARLFPKPRPRSPQGEAGCGGWVGTPQ